MFICTNIQLLKKKINALEQIFLVFQISIALIICILKYSWRENKILVQLNTENPIYVHLH